MSLIAIRSALETHLISSVPSIQYAWENVPYTPVNGTPYAAAYLLPGTPDNVEIGPGYTEQGIFQVSLFYPLDAGPSAATATAEAIRTAFAYPATFTASGNTVHIAQTPEIAPARIEDDRYLTPILIRWKSYQ